MNKKKSKQNDSDSDFEGVDMGEILHSDDEYCEKDKKLLHRISEKHKLNDSDNEEVIRFNNEDYDYEHNDSMASDIEGANEDFYLPDEKAWGKKKKDYYSTDFIDSDYASANQTDMNNAELEEKEAKNLQIQLAEQLDENDFGLDLMISKNDTKYNKVDEYIQYDISKLNKRQKQGLFEKESPEFSPLVVDFQDRLIEASKILKPFLKLLKKFNCQVCPATNFIKAKYDLLLLYCTNISFYLMLKAKREPINSHPVIKRLAQYRQLLIQLENYQGNILNGIQEILEANLNNRPLWNLINLNTLNTEKNKVKSKESRFEDHSMDDDISELGPKILENIDPINIEADKIEVEKRAITYQIAKNKGLTPFRKKEQRNPRVKHRNKYRKAKIRRRGAVREVRKESTRYGGEISGIKAGVKKSIKLK